MRRGGLWFDAQEFDQCLAEVYPIGAASPEVRIPERGLSARRCPPGHRALATAGWTGFVLDRCPDCRGLFVEAKELAHLERQIPPHDAVSLELRIKNAIISAGWALLTAEGLAALLLQFLR